MSKLNVIDQENLILEGEFEKIRVADKTFLDEQNILEEILKYKEERVDKGLAFGYLNDGFLIMPTEDGDQVVEEDKDPAFMIIDIYWNQGKKTIEGKIILLDSDDGNKVKNELSQGVECYMSASETEVYTSLDKEHSRMMSRIINIKGYKLSLLNFHSTI